MHCRSLHRCVHRRARPCVSVHVHTSRGVSMERLAVLALLEARPGMEAQLESFLASALPLAIAEAGTIAWYALRLDASRFAIVDTFAGKDARDAHLSGEIASALMASADALLARPPRIEQAEIVAAKSAASLARSER